MNRNRYHPASVFFHWMIFLLFVIALAVIEYRGDVPKGDPLRDTLRTIHMMTGQLVFLFAAFRIAARFRFGVPAALPGPRWQTWSGEAVHILLYVIMFALPITGVLFTQAGGRDVSFFGLILPQLISPDAALKESIRDIHELIGNAVYYVVGLHALAALWHHFIRKDSTLRRMLNFTGKD
ncbi:cytochrome b [Herbaspirillum sp. RTI4]|uniref:cytochrome b n=1 Tax=Herbaspirillum sp. RTI4 TaxID=3048640 RepID=UPI002AB4A88B|nr:cytochrome b [Herbaspirillum sp. RTI4]MDY7579754.1 cytochrome b [Herbaspirillum sp. RTI4]MEA9982728.1 cytochrome b [Herbaspirillum sp. RTI4]